MSLRHFDSLWEYVARWAREEPDRAALRFGDQALTYAQLDLRSDRVAASLLELGVKRGERVATILPPCPEYVIALLAADKLGAITVPLDVRFRTADLRRFLGASEPRVLVTIEEFDGNPIASTLAELAPDLGVKTFITLKRSGLGRSFRDLVDYGAPDPATLATAAVRASPADGSLIIFTGGTTGRPKAALLTRRNVGRMCGVEADALAAFLAAGGVHGPVRTLANLPPSHVGGTVELLGAPLAAGWEIILQEKWSPYPVLEAIQEERIPFIGAVPTMYAILLSLPDLDRYDLSSLKLALLSGERVPLELLEGIRSRICETIVVGYGSTEAGAEVTFTDPSDPLEELANGMVGRPLPGVELRVVDPEDRTLPSGEVGEVQVRGQLTIGDYFRMPEEKRAGFAPGGWCRTGDLGYLSADGRLNIEGRLKHIIRVGSYTVLPTEIEEVALQDPDVGTAAAIGVPHEIYGEVVWLYVTPREGRTVSEERLLERYASELADFKVPKRIIVRDSLPTSRIGKVDRRALMAEAPADGGSESDAAPED